LTLISVYWVFLKKPKEIEKVKAEKPIKTEKKNDEKPIKKEILPQEKGTEDSDTTKND
jgi:hypothetical protein